MYILEFTYDYLQYMLYMFMKSVAPWRWPKHEKAVNNIYYAIIESEIVCELLS